MRNRFRPFLLLYTIYDRRHTIYDLGARGQDFSKAGAYRVRFEFFDLRLTKLARLGEWSKSDNFCFLD